MILGRLEDAAKYRTSLPELTEVFDYLRQTDFSLWWPTAGTKWMETACLPLCSGIAPSRWPRSSGSRIGSTSTCSTSSRERSGWAARRRDGSTVLQPYDARTDAVLYRVEGDFFEVHAGCFAVFTPDDIHAPGLAIDAPGGSEEVCKVVVKKKIEKR